MPDSGLLLDAAAGAASAVDAVRDQTHDIAIVGMACVFPGIGGLPDFWASVATGAGCEADGPEEPDVSHVLAAALQDLRSGRAPDATGSATARLVMAAAGLSPFDTAGVSCGLDVAERIDSVSALDAVGSVVARLRDLACDMGLAVGVRLPPRDGLVPACVARPYTSSAGGSAATRGCAALMLKRRADAERDGDRVYALVAGLHSSPDRVTALRMAYAGCGIDPASVAMIEGVGTATPDGDAREIATLHSVFGQSGFPEAALGSVSAIVGSAGPAAAMAGLIKAALAIDHRALPPMPGAEHPHPDLLASRICLHAKLRPWVSLAGSPRRAGINMEGPPGTYGHVVLERHAGETVRPWRSLTPWGSELIVISALTREALQEEIRRVQRVAVRSVGRAGLASLAFTLAARFSDDHTFRLTTVARDAAELGARLAIVDQRLGIDTTDGWKNFAFTYFGSAPQSGKIGFLFPGVGFPGLAGGYADRLGELALHFPGLLDWLDRAETVCAADELSYRLSFQLFPPPYCDLAVLAEIEEQLKWSQRASVGTMIANLATFSLVRALGLRADAMAGFSLGEWSALVAAGIIDMEAAAVTAQGSEESSALAEATEAHRGTWAMVSASADDIEAVIQPLGDDVSVTIDVSPEQAFIGGEESAVGLAIGRLLAAGIWASPIPSSPLMASFSAFHTKYAAPYRAQLTRTLNAMPLKRLDCDIYSSVTGRLFPADPAGIVKILGQNVTDAVRMRATLQTMHRHGIRIFLQLGGGGRLLPTVQKNLALEPHTALSIDVEYLSGLEQLQYALAQLLALGIPFNPLLLYAHRVLEPLDLEAPEAAPPAKRPEVRDAPAAPGHPLAPAWLEELFEIERRTDRAFSKLLTSLLDAARPSRPSPLLGEVIDAAPGRLRLRLTLDLAVHSFLGQHVLLAAPGALKPVQDLLPTLPFAFAIEIMAQAAQALLPDRTVLDCHNVEAISWIGLEGTDTLALSVVAERRTETDVQVEISIEGDARPAMRGRVATGAPLPEPAPMAFACDDGCPLSAADYYGQGPLFQGPLFRAITALSALSADSVAGEVALRDPDDLFARDGRRRAPLFDPILLDSVAQMLGVPAWVKERRLLVPIRVRRVSRYGALPPPGTRVHARINHRRLDERRVEGDFAVTGPAGETLLRVEGWEELWMIWPRCLLERNHRPRDGAIGRAWSVGDPSLSCSHVARAHLGDIDPAWIARYYLTAREWARYARAPDVLWLLRRIAAKDCVRDWFRRHRGAALHPLEVEIADLPDGGAALVTPGQGPAAIALIDLDGEAVAVASTTATVALGVASMVDGGAGPQAFDLSQREMACLPSDEADRTAWARRAWCAKEASVKACGRGSEALRHFVVERVREDDGVVEIRNELHDVMVKVATAADGRRTMALSVTRQLPALAPALDRPVLN